MINTRTEEAERFLTATKKARRHMNANMSKLLEATAKAVLHEGPIPKELIGQYERPISINSDFMLGAYRMIKVWFDLYEEANKIWQEEAGIGHYVRNEFMID